MNSSPPARSAACPEAWGRCGIEPRVIADFFACYEAHFAPGAVGGLTLIGDDARRLIPHRPPGSGEASETAVYDADDLLAELLSGLAYSGPLDPAAEAAEDGPAFEAKRRVSVLVKRRLCQWFLDLAYVVLNEKARTQPAWFKGDASGELPSKNVGTQADPKYVRDRSAEGRIDPTMHFAIEALDSVVGTRILSGEWTRVGLGGANDPIEQLFEEHKLNDQEGNASKKRRRARHLQEDFSKEVESAEKLRRGHGHPRVDGASAEETSDASAPLNRLKGRVAGMHSNGAPKAFLTVFYTWAKAAEECVAMAGPQSPRPLFEVVLTEQCRQREDLRKPLAIGLDDLDDPGCMREHKERLFKKHERTVRNKLS